MKPERTPDLDNGNEQSYVTIEKVYHIYEGSRYTARWRGVTHEGSTVDEALSGLSQRIIEESE